MLLEFGPQSDDAKAKGLKKGEKYYYLFFIATKKEKRGKGRPKFLTEPCHLVRCNVLIRFHIRALNGVNQALSSHCHRERHTNMVRSNHILFAGHL
jgi:hypothetical protein